MKTPLDVLCTATHAATPEDLAPALQALSYEGLEEVLEVYRSYSLNRPVAGPTKNSHALRPYLVSDNKNAMPMGGFLGGSSIFDSQDKLWTTIDRLKHRLLYCHSVATDDPFRIGLALARTNIVSNDPVRKDTLLANLASFAIAVDSLVRAEIIVFVEFHERSGRPLDAIEKHVDALLGDNSLTYDDDARELIRYIEKLDSEHGQRLSKNLAEKHTLHQIVLRRFSISRISQALHTAQTDGDILTPYLPFEQDVRNLAQIEHSDLVQDRLSKANFAPKDQDLLRSLGRLAIPGLDKIDISDIKAIRDADGFALWRSEISDALHHVQGVMDAGPVSDSELQKDFLQQMEGSQDKIEQEFKSSNTLANVKAASISVGTGFIAPAMTYLIDPSATLLGLQIGGMAAAAAGLAQSYPKSKSPQTLRPVMKHFVSILN